MYTSIFKSKSKLETSAKVTWRFEEMNMVFARAFEGSFEVNGRLSCRELENKESGGRAKLIERAC